MTRVHDRHVSAAPSAADRHRRVDQKGKASYKVILEEVADKQKKLKTVLYPEQKAPIGYTFIPAGDPQLTNRCKKLAREDGFTVFIVSTSRHPRQGLSREIHRVGFHFPSITVEKACDSLGVTLSNSGRVLQSNFAHLEDGQEHDGKRSTKPKSKKAGNRNQQPALDISLPQAVIDTSARETIRDLFPNIPNQDLHAIVGRSFQKGKGLVGTVANLSLVRRAQLAVIAHIRHTYTDYDALLKQVQYNEARRRVEQRCLDRLIRWRGDDDDAGDMEDVLREVIVIPDDDEDDANDGDEPKESLRIQPGENERDSSVEYISEADMQIQPVDYSNINRAVERGDSYSPVSDQEVQYLGRNKLRHGRQVLYDQQTLDRMGTRRQRVYKEALDRRREHPEHLNIHNDDSSISVFASSGRDKVHPSWQQAQDQDYLPYSTQSGEQTLGRSPFQTRLMPVARPEGYRVDPYSNKRNSRYILEEQVGHPSQQERRNYEESLEQPRRVYYAEGDQIHNNRTRPLELRQPLNRVSELGENFVNQHDIGQENRNNLYANDFEAQSRRRSEMVLPSIERDIPVELSDQTSLHRGTAQVNPFGSYRPLSRGMQQLPAPPIINLDDFEEPPSSKRRRINDQQPVNSHGQTRTILVPIEQIDDRLPEYERPHEAMYRDDGARFVSDKRIVRLPPKREQARSPISHEKLPLTSPRNQITRRPDQVVDRVERYPQPRDHYQIPLSRSENVENLQFPLRAKVAPPEYSNNSPSFLQSSQISSRKFESSDLGVSSRQNVGVFANSDPAHVDFNGITRSLQPLEIAQGSMPSRISDMPIDYRQRDDDRVTYHPVRATADIPRQNGPSTGVLQHISSANVDGHMGHAMNLLAYSLDTARGISYQGIEPPTNTYSHDINGRRMQQLPRVQHQPALPTEQVSSSPYQLDHQFSELQRGSAFERRALPPAPRAAIEPWEPNLESRNRPLDRGAGSRPLYSGVGVARQENIRPFRRYYDDIGLGRRKGPDDIVVLD